VDEVEHLAQVPADAVQGVGHDSVAGPGELQQFGQALALDACAGLFVGVDPLVGDACGRQRVELALQGLLGG
jgi:hypothetical protein